MKFGRIDKRVVIIDKQNEGSILSRKKGIETAKSDYVMFVDADDWIDKKTIECLYNEIKTGDYDVVVSNITKVLGGVTLFKQRKRNPYFIKSKVYKEHEIREELVVAYFHGHPFPSSLCAKIYRKELLVKSGNYLNDISFLGDDLFYNLGIFLKANKVKLINKSFYYYRSGGFTSKYMPTLFSDMVNGYQIQKKVINEYFKESIQKQYNGISIMLLNTFKTCLQNLFNSRLTESEKHKIIRNYTLDKSVFTS